VSAPFGWIILERRQTGGHWEAASSEIYEYRDEAEADAALLTEKRTPRMDEFRVASVSFPFPAAREAMET
jgi:hypothetical protein